MYRMGFNTKTYYFTDKRNKQNKSDTDSYIAQDNIVIVIDEVNKFLPEDTKKTDINISGFSKLVCEYAFNYIKEQLTIKDLNPMLILKNTAKELNSYIIKYNLEQNIDIKTCDYIKKQPYALTFAFGLFVDDMLYFAQLNDCGVMVFDTMQNREIDFSANQTPFIEHLQTKYEDGTFAQGSIEEHVYIRKHMVNNKNYNFGVLNGDNKALELVHYGATNLQTNQLVLFYSDGFIPFVYNNEFIAILFKEAKEYVDAYIIKKEQEADKYKKEKTLIALKAN